MYIKEITDKAIWTDFFNENGSPSFHQAWEWGLFQQAIHNDVLYLGLYDHDKLVCIALTIKIRARRGNYLLIPHGPISCASIIEQRTRHFSHIFNYLKEIATKENFWFIRVAPSLHETSENTTMFEKLGFREAPIYVHAERMWAVDLTQSEDEILVNMRKTTRYLIKKAIKDEITIEKRTDEKTTEDFWELYKETFTRENFTPFSKQFIRQEFESFHTSDNALFFFGKVPQKFAQEGVSEILAGSLVIFIKSTAFYHQGASIHSKHPVPYLLQWEAMKEAKQRGCKTYCFHGILKEGRTPKAWTGLTLFKKGFGGYQIDYVPTQDLVISPKYWLSFFIDKYLAFKRGI